MLKINLIAVAIVAIISFIASGFYYGFLFAELYPRLAGIEPGALTPTQIAAQLLRDLVVTYALARLIILTSATGVLGALKLGLLVWFGFLAMAIAGAVIHENYPWQLYAIHTGDALMKIVIASLILGAFPRRSQTEA